MSSYFAQEICISASNSDSTTSPEDLTNLTDIGRIFLRYKDVSENVLRMFFEGLQCHLVVDRICNRYWAKSAFADLAIWAYAIKLHIYIIQVHTCILILFIIYWPFLSKCKWYVDAQIFYKYLYALSVRLQIQEVTDVMRDNVQKVIDRGERLEDLQEASDRLNMAGNEFREAARRAQRKAWLQNVKSKIIIISITVTVVLFIIGREWRVTKSVITERNNSMAIHHDTKSHVSSLLIHLFLIWWLWPLSLTYAPLLFSSFISYHLWLRT